MSVHVQERTEILAGDMGRGQLYGADTGEGHAWYRRTAERDRNVEAGRLHRHGEEFGAAEMTDAQKVLDMEEDAGHGFPTIGILRRMSLTAPSAPSSN